MEKVDQIKNQIVEKFGFFPPFFEPALTEPIVLENLWYQTLTAYVENPIPDLFKEKLAAMIARYCSVPYCLVCHSSTLKPLGMKPGEILNLLELPPLQSQELETALDKYLPSTNFQIWPTDPQIEELILQCSVAIFLHVDNKRCHEWLRQILSASCYDLLILFIAYNRTCLSWAEAHPELSYEADARAKNNLGHILEMEPKLSEFFQNYSSKFQSYGDQRLRWLTEENRTLVENERKNAESLKNLISQLKEERETLQRFTDSMTHDLRSPLTSASMNIQLLKRSSADEPKTFEKLGKIELSLKRIDQMIDDLLDASRARSISPTDLPRSEIELLRLVQGFIQDVRFDDLKIEVKGNPVNGFWNKEIIQRILDNLVGNAIKHGDRNRLITITVGSKDNIATLKVHNFGKTISATELGKIFNRFERADSTQKGWGIGLSVVKSLCEALSGTVEIDSSEELGTTFCVTLPTNN